MSTSFPTGLDNFTNPTAGQTLAAGGHTALHGDNNDAIEALEAKVGVDASAVVTSLDFLLKGVLGVFTQDEIAITGATTATVGRAHLCSGTTADYAVTLPAASGNAGRLISFRMSPALTKIVTIDADGAELIDAQATRAMHDGESAILLCDGAGWFKIAGKTIPLTAQVNRAAAQSIDNATVTKILFDETTFDTAGVADITTNDRIDVKRAGRYLVTAGWYVPSGSGQAQSRVHINGAERKTVLMTTFPALPVVTEAFELTVGDYIELHVYQTTGGSVNTDTATPTRPRLTVVEIPAW